MSGNRPARRRRPRDEAARQRLVELQRLEADNVAVALIATDDLNQARAKRDQVIETAQSEVTDAELALARAREDLVGVSGVHRAALLLDLPEAELTRPEPKPLVGRPPNAARSQHKSESTASRSG